ncbi:MAG TPA: phosphatidylserine decarboxylase [Lachnospiraceae bacterium]|nr:phosphatidylserine decarboxylase [Lachnospiraceae bacterium]
MQIWNRDQQCFEQEQEYGLKKLHFLYGTIPGRMMLKTFVCRRWFSELLARKQRSRSSVNRIEPFVKKYHIDLSEYNRQQFQSFNDFFTRQRRYHTKAPLSALIAIADARLSCYEICENLTLNIKNSVYSLEELTGIRSVAEQYAKGYCLIYRLAVQDYHRYVFGDCGCVKSVKEIDGVLHTIRPIARQYRVFCTNHRICSELSTKHFGEVLQIEVGALTVGKINNIPTQHFERLQEKGYFSYGGSTIIQLFQKDRIVIEEDILRRNQEGYEVKVKIGDTIGSVKGRKEC